MLNDEETRDAIADKIVDAIDKDLWGEAVQLAPVLQALEMRSLRETFERIEEAFGNQVSTSEDMAGNVKDIVKYGVRVNG